FEVNWDSHPAPMSAITENPPLASYYLAMVGSLAGWSEVALHLGMLLPAIAGVVGTWFLARRLCDHPMMAALATLAAPVYLMCGSGVMCDMMMTALWVWAVFFWMDGLGQSDLRRLWLASGLIGLCGLTKYFGLCLIPLLTVYTLLTAPHRW